MLNRLQQELQEMGNRAEKFARMLYNLESADWERDPELPVGSPEKDQFIRERIADNSEASEKYLAYLNQPDTPQIINQILAVKMQNDYLQSLGAGYCLRYQTRMEAVAALASRKQALLSVLEDSQLRVLQAPEINES